MIHCCRLAAASAHQLFALVQEQKALMDMHATKGITEALSLEESRHKLEEEAAEAKRKAMIIAENNSMEDDEEGNENHRKRMKTHDENEDQDINEEDEVMYMQALQGKEDEADPVIASGDEYDNNDDEFEQKTKKQKTEKKDSSSSVTMPRPDRKQSAVLSPKSRAAPAGTSVPLNLKTLSLAPSTGTPPATPTASAAAKQPVKQAHPVAFVPGDHKTWTKCDLISSLGISSEHGGKIFAPPSLQSYKKNANNMSKWGVEVAKLKPWMVIFENLYASDHGIRVTEQQAKTALTQAKKVNNKVDKRVGYETVSKGEITFHSRAVHLKDALQATKDFRSQALGSAKGGPIAPDILEKSISQIQKPLQALVEGFNPAFPLHWVQASRQSA